MKVRTPGTQRVWCATASSVQVEWTPKVYNCPEPSPRVRKHTPTKTKIIEANGITWEQIALLAIPFKFRGSKGQSFSDVAMCLPLSRYINVLICCWYDLLVFDTPFKRAPVSNVGEMTKVGICWYPVGLLVEPDSEVRSRSGGHSLMAV